ncbi:4'-phosphopantetheinyl transferase superfamily protein [Streptomyces sp. NPDC046197]|uniref:4'-phosphopantetheinyl transferase family protein n=1 Tax=Streptomyces sp. NPDC046197 TaxID=3154337 RepID=UPI0033DA69E6
MSIAELLPAVARAAQIVGHDCEVQLLPEEAAALGRVAEPRKREFAAGRICARRALRALGRPAVAIPIGAHREPVWPQGVVGSITHCPGYCAAAVAPERDLAAVGIDGEPHERLPDDVLGEIASRAELAALDALPRGSVHWGRVLFSAKESMYKAWFPLTFKWLDFTDVSVTVDSSDGTFHGRLLEPAIAGTAPTRFDGRFVVRAGLVLTAVAVARSGPLVPAAPGR